MFKKLQCYILKSIRIQLITTFFLCALLGFVVSRAAAPLAEGVNSTAYVDYSTGMKIINFQAKQIAEKAISENKINSLQEIINSKAEEDTTALKVLITDETGKVLYKTKQAQEVEINLHNTISNVMNFAVNQVRFNKDASNKEEMRKEFLTFYPITVEGKNLYMFVSGIPEGSITYDIKEGVFPTLLGVIVFIFLSFI